MNIGLQARTNVVSKQLDKFNISTGQAGDMSMCCSQLVAVEGFSIFHELFTMLLLSNCELLYFLDF